MIRIVNYLSLFFAKQALIIANISIKTKIPLTMVEYIKFFLVYFDKILNNSFVYSSFPLRSKYNQILTE